MHYWQLLRPQQWIKNAFVWAGFLFARAWHDAALAQQVALAFIAFCLLASAVYIGNDWLDRDADRAHPTKRERPLASGRIGGAAAGIARHRPGALPRWRWARGSAPRSSPCSSPTSA